MNLIQRLLFSVMLMCAKLAYPFVVVFLDEEDEYVVGIAMFKNEEELDKRIKESNK